MFVTLEKIQEELTSKRKDYGSGDENARKNEGVIEGEKQQKEQRRKD